MIHATSALHSAASSVPGLGCALAGPATLSCATPKSLRPGELVDYTIVLRTATDAAAAAATILTATAQAKERSADRKNPSDPSTESVSVSNETPYEASSDVDLSWAGGGIGVTLATSQTGAQFSRLPLAAAMAPGFAELVEEDCAPEDLLCIGQEVTTVAVGLAPVNL